MVMATLQQVRFAGMASCVPRHIVSNLDDCPPSMRAERERLVRNIGISQRRMCQPWQCFSDLAAVAAEKLLAELGWDRAEVDALIVVTQSPDYILPSTAVILQDRLGLSNATIAYDINLGCSGYPFGIHALGSMIASGSVKKGLLLVGDKSASLLDPLFSDAASATALVFDPSAPPMHLGLFSDGSGYKTIMKPIGGHREPYAPNHMIPTRDEHGQLHFPDALMLDGPAVLSFSTQKVPPHIVDMLAFAGLGKDEIDYFVLHQANRMINETIRKKLQLPPEKVPSTLAEFGNTSVASLPVTITAKLHEALASGTKRLLLSGFGVGLSWGTLILQTDAPVLPAMVEI